MEGWDKEEGIGGKLLSDSRKDDDGLNQEGTRKGREKYWDSDVILDLASITLLVDWVWEKEKGKRSQGSLQGFGLNWEDGGTLSCEC